MLIHLHRQTQTMEKMKHMDRYQKAAFKAIIEKYISFHWKSVVTKQGGRKHTILDLIATVYAIKSNDFFRARAIGNVNERELRDVLTDNEISVLVSNFGLLLGYAYKHYMSSFNEHIFEDPSGSLLKIISCITPLKDGDRVLVPYSGGLRLAFMNKNCTFELPSRNVRNNALCDIAREETDIQAYHIESSIEECLVEAEKSHTKYDHIIAIPSWIGDLIPEENQYAGLKERLIRMLEGALNEEGTLSVFLKESVCSNFKWNDFREYLLKHKYAVRIIRLPIDNIDNLSYGCLLVIEKIKAEQANRRPIVFADLSSKLFRHHEDQSPFFTLDVEAIVNAYNNIDPQYFVKVYPWDIKDGYNLSPREYPISDESRISALVHNFMTTPASADRLLATNPRNGKSLIASLYSLRADANKDVVNILASISIDLSKEMSKENIQFLLDSFSRVIDVCYNTGVYNDDSEILSKDYLELLTRLCEKSDAPGTYIYLPHGQLRLASMLKSPYIIDSVESTPEGWAISYIIREIQHLGANLYRKKEECADTDIITEEGGYDYIISFLSGNINDHQSTIAEFIDCLKNRLSPGGSMILGLPREACYSKAWIQLRQFLTENHTEFHTAVMSLSIPSSTSINEGALFIIERARPWSEWQEHDRIILIDADKDEFILSDPQVGPYGIKVDSIMESIDKIDSKAVRLVPIANLDEGYNFTPARYFRYNLLPAYDSSNCEVVKLKDIIEIYPYEYMFNVGEDASEYKVITPAVLSDNYLACRIDMEHIPMQKVQELFVTTAKGGYAALANGKLHVGKIEDDPFDLYNLYDDEAIMDHSVCHFHVKSNKTSLDYILKILSSCDYVAQQAKYLTKGYSWIWQFLHSEDLLEIEIILPSIATQNEELLADSRRGLEAKDAEIQRNFDEFRRNMHMQKHKIGQTISALCSWVEQINYARQICNGVVDDSAIIFPAYNTSAKDIFEKLTITAEKLQKEILALDSSYGMEKDVEDIALADFLDEYISKNDVWSGRKFELVWDSWAHRYTKDLPMIEFDESDEYHVKSRLIPGEFIIKAGDPMEYIRGTYRSLETILDNIIANALSHGFKRQDKIYKIKFDIITDDEQVILLVSNNGEPLHERMKSDEVFTYGHTSGDDSHSGIGCYQIKDYMDTLKGRVEIISTPEEEFTVKYKLTFVNANPSVTITL